MGEAEVTIEVPGVEKGAETFGAISASGAEPSGYKTGECSSFSAACGGVA
jgi:hypothetical protein